MIDKRGSVLVGSIVAGEGMIDRCDYSSFKMDSEQCWNFWSSPVMWKIRGSNRSPPFFLSCASCVIDGDLKKKRRSNKFWFPFLLVFWSAPLPTDLYVFVFYFSVSGSQWEDQEAAVGTGFLLGRVAVEGRMVELLVIFLVVAERGRGYGQWFQVGSGGGARRTRRTDPGFMRKWWPDIEFFLSHLCQ